MINIEEHVNSVIIGDSRDKLKEFPDNSVDFTLTSPPYNIGSLLGSVDRSAKKTYKKYKDNLNEEEYYNFLIEIIDELLRVTKKYILFNVMYVSKNRSALFKLIGKYHNNIKDILIWEKKIQPAINKTCLTHNYEFIFVLNKEKENRAYKELNFGNTGDFRTCFKEKDNSAANSEAFWCDINSAIMSINLARRMITTFTKEGDLILDPFLGAGTTIVACKETNRRFIGIELDKECLPIINKRLEKVSESLFNYTERMSNHD
jgi:DNA modification methylase